MIEVKAKAVQFDKTFHGFLIKTHHPSNNATATRTALHIPKDPHSVEAFMGWPQDQSIDFVCDPEGSYNYFLVDESPTMYIFEIR